MSARIFDISEGTVVINENCLLIPELKKIVETYEDPIPVLAYVHYMSDPFGPYSTVNPDEKEDIILTDYPGNYTADDEPVYLAIKKLNKLYETESMRLMRQARMGLKKLGDFLEHAQIDQDREGNFLTQFKGTLKDIRKINQEFNGLVKDVEEEFRIRGNNQLGYDEL